MKDDYLWNRSGEPDADIEDLERIAGQLRYRERPLILPVRTRRRFDWRIVAAASILMIAIAGIVIYLNQRERRQHPQQVAAHHAASEGNSTGEKERQEKREETTDSPRESIITPGERPTYVARRARKVVKASPPQGALSLGAHIEGSQMLLRAFRNAASTDIAYEKQRSRRLLQQNILLRRDSEAKADLPVAEMLDGLERVLLDIANLPDHPKENDVEAIKRRIEKNQTVAMLQAYSSVGITY